MKMAEVLTHLDKMIVDYENFMIPTQTSKDAIEILTYDKEVLIEARNILSNLGGETNENN